MNYNGNSEAVKTLNRDLTIAEITMIMVGNSIIQYINEDITAEECVTEILLNGAGTIVYQLGLIAGGSLGVIIITIIVSQISKTALEYRQFQKINMEKENQINTIGRESLIEMEYQRRKL